MPSPLRPHSAALWRRYRPAEAIRDIPASCACWWQWIKTRKEFVISGSPRSGCPWHGRPGR